jgi:hypothetical protein
VIQLYDVAMGIHRGQDVAGVSDNVLVRHQHRYLQPIKDVFRHFGFDLVTFCGQLERFHLLYARLSVYQRHRISPGWCI